LPPERIEHYFVPRLFAEIAADDMVEDLLDLGTQLAPDLLIHDAEAFAGPLVADLLGCRSVHHLFGPMLAPDVLALASDAVSPLWRSYDRTVPPAAGMYRDRTVAICPPSLEQHDPPAGELLRLRPTPLPASPPRPEPTPLVYVTFGTLWANPELLSTVLRALADEPVQVVATSGRLHPSDISNVPENAQVEQFVPQQELLPRCSVVVHHAGAGTMFGALAHGLPQVALPQAADNFVNAELLASAGVGRTLLPHEVSPRSVRDAVRDVLTNRPYRAQARQVADEIADMPGAEQVAQQLRG
jgi:UDP:flavonoid glycosyltransferase YjiC (YdhE family)